MIRIGEDDLRVQVEQIARGERFDGRLGADGHEDGSFDDAVGGVQQAGARAGFRTLGLDLKAESGHANPFWRGRTVPARLSRLLRLRFRTD